MTPIVLLRSNDYNFLGCLRALTQAGAAVVPVVFDWPGAPPWYSEASRLFHDAVRIPNPYREEAAAVAALAALGARLRDRFGEPPLVIPSSDTNLMLLVNHWPRFAGIFRMYGAADWNSCRAECVEKGRSAALLRAGNVPLPATFVCDSETDIEAILRRVPFPALYKPDVKDYGQSFYRAHGGLKAVACDTPQALCEALKAELAAGFRLVVQERLPFDSAREEIPCYIYADGAHRVRLAATAIKESIHPAPFGTAAVVRMSWHPDLLPLAQRVAAAMRWRGPLMIEFIRDSRDGCWKVVEINTRPWLFMDFWRHLGLCFLRPLVEDLRGETESWPDLRVPDEALLQSSPVHIDLALEAEAMRAGSGALPDEAAMRRRLASIPGAHSYAYDDPDDPAPARARLQDLARRCGWSQAALQADWLRPAA